MFTWEKTQPKPQTKPLFHTYFKGERGWEDKQTWEGWWCSSVTIEVVCVCVCEFVVTSHIAQVLLHGSRRLETCLWRKKWWLNRSFSLWQEKSYRSRSFFSVIWEMISVWEDGKNSLSAGKSAPCDKNEVWAYMYNLVDFWCVMQKVILHALWKSWVLKNHDASFSVTALQLKQWQLKILLVFHIGAFTVLLDCTCQSFSLQLWGRGT